jgi:hypothetical protein
MPDKKPTYEVDRRNGLQIMALGGVVIFVSLGAWGASVVMSALNVPWPAQAGCVVGMVFAALGSAMYLTPGEDEPAEKSTEASDA